MLLGSLSGSLYKSQEEVWGTSKKPVGHRGSSRVLVLSPRGDWVFGIVPEKGKPSILNHSRNSKEGFTEKAILFGELNSFVPKV